MLNCASVHGVTFYIEQNYANEAVVPISPNMCGEWKCGEPPPQPNPVPPASAANSPHPCLPGSPTSPMAANPVAWDAPAAPSVDDGFFQSNLSTTVDTLGFYEGPSRCAGPKG